MRAGIFALVLGAATMSPPSRARASPAGADVHAAEIDRLLHSGRRIKAAGQVLIAVGCIDANVATILGPLGLWAESTAPAETTPAMRPRGSDVSMLEGAAIGLAVTAATLIAVGIPLMAEGDARLARARTLVGYAPVHLAAARSGLALTW